MTAGSQGGGGRWNGPRLKISARWNVTPCSLVETYGRSRVSFRLRFQGGLYQNCLRDLCTSTKLHCVIFQKTTIVLGATVRNFMLKELEVPYYRVSLPGTWELSTHFVQSLNCDTFVLGLFTRGC